MSGARRPAGRGRAGATRNSDIEAHLDAGVVEAIQRNDGTVDGETAGRGDRRFSVVAYGSGGTAYAGARNGVAAGQVACLFSLMGTSQRLVRMSRGGSEWSVAFSLGVVCRGGRWLSVSGVTNSCSGLGWVGCKEMLMSKPSQRNPEWNLQMVLSVLRGEVSAAENRQDPTFSRRLVLSAVGVEGRFHQSALGSGPDDR